MTPERWQQIDKLLEQALEQKSDRRAAFLDEACNGDAALRQEVESLLAAHGKAADFIEAPALEAGAPTRGAVVQIAAGEQLGPYKILSLLGAGGMGEVYRAKDDRIGREVAIKVLPPAFSADADRLRRFEQEARAAGRLNHPNVLALYDVGTHEGSPYLVSELLQGETLRDRLRGKPLPLRKAHRLCAADGSRSGGSPREEHRASRFETGEPVHHQGRASQDSGFWSGKAAAKTRQGHGHRCFDRDSRSSIPNQAIVLGTVGYMSPEQVRGESTDHRSDIFAFGAILYEMLSGQRAFQAKSSVETMNAILKEEPPELSKANRQIPRALEHIVRHCLEKAPEQRFQSARDLAFNLEELLGSADSTSESRTPLPERLKRRQRFVWILSGLCLLALLSAAFVAYTYFRHPRVNLQSLRFTVSPPEKAVFEESLALSPDGRWLAFVASMGEGKRSLWLRPLDSLAARALPGTEGAIHPFWSPDSRALAFFAQGKLKKIEVSGGPPQILSDALRFLSAGPGTGTASLCLHQTSGPPLSSLCGRG